MQCTKCGKKNRAFRQFCSQCGERLRLLCVSCGVQNEAGELFCEECGATLARNTEPTDASSATKPEFQLTSHRPDASRAVDGECKTVTALFADSRDSDR